MTPLFDPLQNHVGWLEGPIVFGNQIEWLAFIHDGHVYHAATHQWLGPWNDGALLDRRGLVVGWTPDRTPRARSAPRPLGQPMAPPRPFPPKRPIMPRRPPSPQTPAFEWSPLGWSAWLAVANPPPPPPVADPDNSAAVDDSGPPPANER